MHAWRKIKKIRLESVLLVLKVNCCQLTIAAAAFNNSILISISKTNKGAASNFRFVRRGI